MQIISKQNLRDSGVIGSARAAELYGLNILECNFQVVKPFFGIYLKFRALPIVNVHKEAIEDIFHQNIYFYKLKRIEKSLEVALAMSFGYQWQYTYRFILLIDFPFICFLDVAQS